MAKTEPTGKEFYKLFKQVLGNKIANYPLLNIKTLNNDNTLYTALISYSSGLIGANKDAKEAKAFQVSGPMVNLKNDVYGTYSENNSRKYCFNWIKKVNK